MNDFINRREMIKIAGAAVAMTALPFAAHAQVSAQAASPAKSRKRIVRVAHLTDIHIQPELKADQGMIACLHHVQSL